MSLPLPSAFNARLNRVMAFWASGSVFKSHLSSCHPVLPRVPLRLQCGNTDVTLNILILESLQLPGDVLVYREGLEHPPTRLQGHSRSISMFPLFKGKMWVNAEISATATHFEASSPRGEPRTAPYMTPTKSEPGSEGRGSPVPCSGRGDAGHEGHSRPGVGTGRTAPGPAGGASVFLRCQWLSQ